MWCIPPKEDAEFVCHMEDVLEVYRRPFNPKNPVVCIDETSRQLIGEKRMPMPVEPGKIERYDYEYKRNGVCNLFVAFEPLIGKRYLQVTDQRTCIDWANFMKYLVDVLYPDKEKITIIMDNLNIHKPSSLYKAFKPEEARRISEKIEIHHTPKHGSWLNMAEIEFSVLTRHLGRRIPEKQLLQQKIALWQELRNSKTVKAKWQFTTNDARIKLRKLYPSINN